jgi:hypothetical protein
MLSSACNLNKTPNLSYVHFDIFPPDPANNFPSTPCDTSSGKNCSQKNTLITPELHSTPPVIRRQIQNFPQPKDLRHTGSGLGGLARIVLCKKRQIGW